ncbi:MAG: hypothetical protein AAB676_12590 [Verrucomicrobiota bacterium]
MSAIMLPGRFTAILQVIRTSDWPELDSKRRPNAKSTGQLREELAPLLGQTTLRPSGQELIIGAALLWHDHLEAAHTIAQQTDTTDGSLLHGMMHRREPDYGNARYWFQRASQHRCYPTIARCVTAFLQDQDERLCQRLLPGGASEHRIRRISA